MYRMLIVDDEPAIVNGLAIMLSKREEVELDIYKAVSSIEALEIAKKNRVDILLSDIRMPVLTGLQLREKILEYWPLCKTIFLTGYSEFDYVYEAIQRPDTNYILKTESNDVVLKAVFSAIGKIIEEKEQWDIVNEARKQLAGMNQIFRRELLESLLTGDYDNISSVTAHFAESGIVLNINSPVLIVIGRLHEINQGMRPNERLEIFYAVQKMLEKSFCSCIVCESTTIAKSEIVLFIQTPIGGGNFFEDYGASNGSKAKTFIKGILESVQDSFKETFNVMLSFIIAWEFVKWDRLTEEYKIMQTVSGKRLLKGAQQLIDLGSPDTFFMGTSKKIQTDARDTSDFNKMIRKFEKILEESCYSEIIECIGSMTNIIKRSFSVDYFTGIEKYYSMLMVFISFINRRNLSFDPDWSLKIERLMALELTDEWNVIEKSLIDLGHYLCEYIQDRREQEGELVITNLQNHIRQNPGGDLSLTRLAESVYFNPSYLSRYYKQVTGQNLSDFINNVKIETAKKMLEDTNLKINEIALDLGFEITSYFTTFFKRLMGITPQDYRNSFLK